MDRFAALTGMPFLNRTVVLQARVTTNPCALRDLLQQRARILLLKRLARRDGSSPPFPSFESRVHEFVADSYRKILVLVHDAAVSVAIVRAIIALLDQCPGFLFFLLFSVDEFFDVAVPIAQCIHFGRAPGFATGLHYICDLVIDLEERHWTARPATAAEFFLAGTNGTEVRPGAGPVLEEHRLAVSQAHDVLHVVLDRLNKARASLRIFILRIGALGLAELAIIVPIAFRGIFSHAVLVVEAAVEPDRRIEGAILVDTQPGQLLIEHFPIFLAEVAILYSPISNRAADAVNELANPRLAFGGVL